MSRLALTANVASSKKGTPASKISPLAARTQQGLDALINALQDHPGLFLSSTRFGSTSTTTWTMHKDQCVTASEA